MCLLLLFPLLSIKTFFCVEPCYYFSSNACQVCCVKCSVHGQVQLLTLNLQGYGRTTGGYIFVSAVLIHTFYGFFLDIFFPFVLSPYPFAFWVSFEPPPHFVPPSHSPSLLSFSPPCCAAGERRGEKRATPTQNIHSFFLARRRRRLFLVHPRPRPSPCAPPARPPRPPHSTAQGTQAAAGGHRERECGEKARQVGRASEAWRRGFLRRASAPRPSVLGSSASSRGLSQPPRESPRGRRGRDLAPCCV